MLALQCDEKNQSSYRVKLRNKMSALISQSTLKQQQQQQLHYQQQQQQHGSSTFCREFPKSADFRQERVFLGSSCFLTAFRQHFFSAKKVLGVIELGQ